MIRNLALALALAASPLVAQDVTVETYTGEVTVPASPEKIAVFDIAALDTLDALGIKVAGVVDKLFVDYVADSAEGAAVVGTLHEPDFEAVAAGGFDLLIAGGRSSEATPDLAKIAPAIDMTIWEDVVGQGLARLDAFGAIFGKEAEAAALAADFDAALADAKAAVAGKGNALIVMTNGPKIYAYGASGRFGWLHSSLELGEAVADVENSTHGEAVSFEFVRDANPDIMIVVDRLAAIGREGDAAATTLDNELVKETSAWKNGDVIYLEPTSLYIAGGGIQSMIATLNEFTSAFSGS